MATANIGFRTVEIVPFSDSSFTKNEGSKVSVTPADMMAGVPIQVTYPDNITKERFADGSIIAYTGNDVDLGSISFTIGKTVGDDVVHDLYELIFPESRKVESGSLDARVMTSPVGEDRTDWTKALHIRLVDPDNTGNEDAPWLSARCVPNSTIDAALGVEVEKVTITFDFIGGQTLSDGRTEIYRVGPESAGTTVV